MSEEEEMGFEGGAMVYELERGPVGEWESQEPFWGDIADWGGGKV